MRPHLLHPLADKRRPSRKSTGRLAALTHRRVSTTHAPATLEATPATLQAVATNEIKATYDIAAQRVREAGGPLDEASYSCACGFVFAASVSTSVSCPHCGSRQAW
jgi:predicted Zn-ribbon and HTH transcriptional regulator